MDLKRLGAVLAVANERDCNGFADFLLTEKLGPRTLQTGHPFPAPLKTYDESIDVLRNSLDAAKWMVATNSTGFGD